MRNGHDRWQSSKHNSNKAGWLYLLQGIIKSKDEENAPVILLTFHFEDNLIFHRRERQRIIKELQGQSVQSDGDTGNCRRDNCQAFYKPILVRVCSNSRWKLSLVLVSAFLQLRETKWWKCFFPVWKPSLYLHIMCMEGDGGCGLRNILLTYQPSDHSTLVVWADNAEGCRDTQ